MRLTSSVERKRFDPNEGEVNLRVYTMGMVYHPVQDDHVFQSMGPKKCPQVGPTNHRKERRVLVETLKSLQVFFGQSCSVFSVKTFWQRQLLV